MPLVFCANQCGSMVTSLAAMAGYAQAMATHHQAFPTAMVGELARVR